MSITHCSRLRSELPCVLHHDLKVVVAVYRAADAFVVLAELVECHNAVGLLRVPLRHELLEHLVGCLPALLNLWVLASIIDLRDVGQRHLPVFVHVELVVGGLDPNLSRLVELAFQCPQELIVAD